LDRYPDAINIKVERIDEAVADPRAVFSGPDPKSHTGAERRSYQEAHDDDQIRS
jgi:hypothetical protein